MLKFQSDFDFIYDSLLLSGVESAFSSNIFLGLFFNEKQYIPKCSVIYLMTPAQKTKIDTRLQNKTVKIMNFFKSVSNLFPKTIIKIVAIIIGIVSSWNTWYFI